METRRELIEAVEERYRAAGRVEKKQILDEFAEIAGYHRKYAIRVLRGASRNADVTRSRSRRIYNEAVVTALTIIWEAADRICGKRLKAVLPMFVESMEHHGHLCLESEVRQRLLGMSAATIDRLLRPIREVAKQRRRRAFLSTPLRKSISIRTFNDWNNPPPGYFEMDMVAHCWKPEQFPNNTSNRAYHSVSSFRVWQPYGGTEKFVHRIASDDRMQSRTLGVHAPTLSKAFGQ